MHLTSKYRVGKVHNIEINTEADVIQTVKTLKQV
jgi:hypothetical protein